MSYKASKTEISTRAIQMIYGNASKNIMKVGQYTLKGKVLINLFIMKHVLIKVMQGRGNYISNQVRVNAILNLV